VAAGLASPARAFVALLVLALGDLVVIAVADVALRPRVGAGRRVGIVLIVATGSRHRLLFGVVGVVGDPLAVGLSSWSFLTFCFTALGDPPGAEVEAEAEAAGGNPGEGLRRLRRRAAWSPLSSGIRRGLRLSTGGMGFGFSRGVSGSAGSVSALPSSAPCRPGGGATLLPRRWVGVVGEAPRRPVGG